MSFVCCLVILVIKTCQSFYESVFKQNVERGGNCDSQYTHYHREHSCSAEVTRVFHRTSCVHREIPQDTHTRVSLHLLKYRYIDKHFTI